MAIKLCYNNKILKIILIFFRLKRTLFNISFFCPIVKIEPGRLFSTLVKQTGSKLSFNRNFRIVLKSIVE